ncbi:MAG TPA: hypothetical protein VF721_23025 [Pyrinomonadaceae bacterium]|jgi:GNAT superfamily N-acetyltransferase
MPLAEFKIAERDEIFSLHRQAFAPFNLSEHLWQPCRQIESLEKNCPRFVWKDRKIGGFAAAYALDKTHFRFNLLVAPESSFQIAASLLEKIEVEIKSKGAKYLQFRLLEGMENYLRFAFSNGFEEIHRMRGMSLAARDFSFEKWKPLGAKLAAKDFVPTTLEAELNSQKNPIENLVKLHRSAQKGWESPDPTWKIRPPDAFYKSLFEAVSVPELFSIMKNGGQFVAYTSAERKNQTGTAVHPNFRNLGAATFLKAENLKMCIAAGANYFETCTASRSMQRVNEKLGYKYNNLTEIRLLKRL